MPGVEVARDFLAMSQAEWPVQLQQLVRCKAQMEEDIIRLRILINAQENVDKPPNPATCPILPPSAVPAGRQDFAIITAHSNANVRVPVPTSPQPQAQRRSSPGAQGVEVAKKRSAQSATQEAGRSLKHRKEKADEEEEGARDDDEEKEEEEEEGEGEEGEADAGRSTRHTSETGGSFKDTVPLFVTWEGGLLKLRIKPSDSIGVIKAKISDMKSVPIGDLSIRYRSSATKFLGLGEYTCKGVRTGVGADKYDLTRYQVKTEHWREGRVEAFIEKKEKKGK